MSERSDPEGRARLAHPSHAVTRRGLGPVGQQPGDLVVAAERLGVSVARARRARTFVSMTSGRQRRTNRPVRRRGTCRQSGPRSHGPRPTPSSPGPNHPAGWPTPCRPAPSHRRRRLEGASQRAGAPPDAFDAQGIHEWVGPRADVRFDELGQRIQAGAGGEGWRQVVREFGVHEGDTRQEMRAAQARFDPVLRRGEDAVARHLGARAGRRGDEEARGGRVFERLGAANDFQVIEQLALVGEQGGDGFRRIQNAAPAEADDEVTPGRPRPSDSGAHVVGGRFARDRQTRS